jgi:hypothetical protein
MIIGEKPIEFRPIANKATRINIQLTQANSKRRYDRNRQNTTHKSGDLVWVEILTRQSKLDPRFHGLFLIHQQITNVKYTIEDNETGKYREEHVNDIIPYYERNWTTIIYTLSYIEIAILIVPYHHALIIIRCSTIYVARLRDKQSDIFR